MTRTTPGSPSYQSIPDSIAIEIRNILNPRVYPRAAVERFLLGMDLDLGHFPSTTKSEKEPRTDTGRERLALVARRAASLDKAIQQLSQRDRIELQGAYAKLEAEHATLRALPNYQFSAIQDLVSVADRAAEDHQQTRIAPELDGLCMRAVMLWLSEFGIENTPNYVQTNSPMVKVMDALCAYIDIPLRTQKPFRDGNDNLRSSTRSRLNRFLKVVLRPD